MSLVRRFEATVAGALAGPCGEPSADPAGAVQGPLLVAVSGGPDSLALLHALARLRRSSRYASMGDRLSPHVAYFDHGLRPATETGEEREFVAAQAAALGLPFSSDRADVRAVASRQRRSIEEAARRCRYEFLGKLARALGAEHIATGHTASDQAETVLLRLVRGTGVAGLGAMRWRVGWPLEGEGPSIIRPLLGLWREDTEAYCAALGLTPRCDPENESSRYVRNRVRHEVLPVLRSLNPRVDEALMRLADSAREAQETVERAAGALWITAARVEPAAVTLQTEPLAAAPAAVRAELLRRALAHLDPDGLPPSRERLQAAARLAGAAAPGTVELPGGVIVTKGSGELCLQREPVRAALLRGTWPLAVPGETRIPGWRIVVEPAGIASPTVDPLVAWLRSAVLSDGVSVSARGPGDRIRPLGMEGHSRKVQDLLVDARVPRQERDALPIVRGGRGIAWVVGVRLAGWASAREGEEAMRVSFFPDGVTRRDVYEPCVDEAHRLR